MKKLFISIVTIASLAACKKEKNSGPQFTKNLISYSNSVGVNANMQYNAEGKITLLDLKTSSITYKYTPAFSMKYAQLNYDAEMKNIERNASGYITKAEIWSSGVFKFFG